LISSFWFEEFIVFMLSFLKNECQEMGWSSRLYLYVHFAGNHDQNASTRSSHSSKLVAQEKTLAALQVMRPRLNSMEKNALREREEGCPKGLELLLKSSSAPSRAPSSSLIAVHWSF
jgi:hypothetical protein